MPRSLRARTETAASSSIAAAGTSGHRGTFPSALPLLKPVAPLAFPCPTASPQLVLPLLHTPESPRRRAPPAAGPALRGQLASGHPKPPRDYPQVAQDLLMLPLPFPLTAGSFSGRNLAGPVPSPPPAIAWTQLLERFFFQGVRCKTQGLMCKGCLLFHVRAFSVL
jgi:hypothetical protein